MAGSDKSHEKNADDGHVIAPMDVEGMPWCHGKNQDTPKYSRQETWRIIGGALKGALLIAGVFLGTFFLFILLLCQMA